MDEQRLRKLYDLPPDRYRFGPGTQVSEIPPRCPGGHEYRPKRVLVGWHPCGCVPGGGHRTYWCRDCGIEQRVPPCTSSERTTSEQGLRF